jgi:arsenite methyltransferase
MKDIKDIIKEKYTEVANQSELHKPAACCGGGTCSNTAALLNKGKDTDANISDSEFFYKGNPVQLANIQKGETVVDLGSGMGQDCFIARKKTGEEGLVIGVDMTEAMIALANKNSDKHEFQNVQFRLGDIENMPIASHKADIVISDGVFRMLSDKKRGVSEMYRILKSNGRFCISDIFWKGSYSDSAIQTADHSVGDMKEAIPIDLFISLLQMQGFTNVSIKKEKEIILSDELLLDFMSDAELVAFNKSRSGIFLITVYGEKSDCSQCDTCTCL